MCSIYSAKPTKAVLLGLLQSGLPYLTTIPLVGSPSYVAYSAPNHRVYLAYSTGLIRQIDLNSTNFLETPFANLATVPYGLSTADSYIFAADGL